MARRLRADDKDVAERLLIRRGDYNFGSRAGIERMLSDEHVYADDEGTMAIHFRLDRPKETVAVHVAALLPYCLTEMASVADARRAMWLLIDGLRDVVAERPDLLHAEVGGTVGIPLAADRLAAAFGRVARVERGEYGAVFIHGSIRQVLALASV